MYDLTHPKKNKKPEQSLLILGWRLLLSNEVFSTISLWHKSRPTIAGTVVLTQRCDPTDKDVYRRMSVLI